jgi:hypothetical protein
MKKIAWYLSATKLERGRTVEVGNVRYKRWQNGLEVTDLTNAGRHGKKVDSFSLEIPYEWEDSYDHQPEFDLFCDTIVRNNQYEKALSFANLTKKNNDGFKLYVRPPQRGIDIQPPESQESARPIHLDTDEYKLEATPLSFSIHDKRDKYNYPVIIPPIGGGRKAIKQFYNWISLNIDYIKPMTFNQLHHVLNDEKIPFHYYLSMD